MCFLLSEEKKDLIKPLFKNKQPNNSALWCYFEGIQKGQTYVDNLDSPTKAVCKLDMSWVYVSDNADLDWIEEVLDVILKTDWVQVVWSPFRKGQYPKNPGAHPFERLEFIERKAPAEKPANVQIVSYSSELYDKLPSDMQEWHVMNYGSKENFLKNALGFYALENGEIACESEIAFTSNGFCELGIITLEEYRKKGYAYATCLKTLEELDKRGLKGIWACDVENEASWKLAEKLGFVNPMLYEFIFFPQKN